jgi:hypothetical protein
VQTVHDQHDGTLDLVVQPAGEGVIEPLVRAPAWGSPTTSPRASARVIGSELDPLLSGWINR